MSANVEINAETLGTVVELVRETLAVAETDVVEPDQLLFFDLGFTSMDLLDLLYRAEEHFEIAIPEGTLAGLARGQLPVDAFEQEGFLTSAGRERLMELLHDTPPELFAERIHLETLPRYCTVSAIARLVEHKRASA